jgi:hypothetical protein
LSFFHVHEVLLTFLSFVRFGFRIGPYFRLSASTTTGFPEAAAEPLDCGFEGEEPFEMVAGSFINIPAHKRHRVEWTDPTQPTIWLAIHYSEQPVTS